MRLFLLVGDVVIVMVAVYMIGKCSGLFTSEIKALCQYKKNLKMMSFADEPVKSSNEFVASAFLFVGPGL